VLYPFEPFFGVFPICSMDYEQIGTRGRAYAETDSRKNVYNPLA
jgi:hypothetical protein